jgi:CubicO group peptidase (beta-lactamase class C family)
MTQKRYLIRLTALIAALWLTSSPAVATAQVVAPPEKGRLTNALDSIVREAVSRETMIGATVAIRYGDDMLFARGYGMADLEQHVPVTASTVFKIGSVTKQFTAAIILKLVEDGEIDLEDELGEFLPTFPTHGETVTVHQLLNHTSGIPSYTGQDDFWSRVAPLELSDEDVVGTVRGMPFDFPAGTEYRYNNTAYFMLGMIIEVVTGRAFREELRDRLLDPLGLEDTFYCEDATIIPHRARGYDVDDEGVRNTTFISMETPGAAGAMCATALDLIRWNQALHGGEVLGEASYKSMTTAGVLPSGDTLSYGYGLAIGERSGHRLISHGGGINGFNTMLAFYPDDDLTVAVIVNTREGAGPLAERLANEVLGIDEPGS